jgi:hypothetical protein
MYTIVRADGTIHAGLNYGASPCPTVYIHRYLIFAHLETLLLPGSPPKPLKFFGAMLAITLHCGRRFRSSKQQAESGNVRQLNLSSLNYPPPL